MTPRNNAAAVSGWSPIDAPKPLASWYTEGICDGVGDRLWMFDNSGTPSLELLRFHPQLATANGFEDALRERVDALDAFEHPAFSRVRAIQRLDGGDLALVSTFTTGKRVSEIFQSPNARAGVHPAFAAWFIRELTSAVAELHRQGDGIAHAGLTADRVILTPDGRLVIVEHVLGSALDRLQLSISRLWHDLGLIAADDRDGRARLDQRTDVIQVAWIALSLLLGRRITPLDYPERVDPLLDEFVGASRGRSPLLVSALRRWLERALHDRAGAFESAIQAQAGLGDLSAHGGSRTVPFIPSRMTVDQLAFEPPAELPPVHAAGLESTTLEFGSGDEAWESSNWELPPTATATPFAADPLESLIPEDVPPMSDAAVNQARPPMAGWIVAAVLALVAVAEAGWIGRFQLARAAALPPPVPVVVDSLQQGDTVIVDGREAGVTPLTLILTSGVRSIRVRTRPTVENKVPIPQAAASVRPVDSAAAATLAQAAARERRGGLRLSSPIELQVLEGERVLGSSADGPIVTTGGRHELDFVNNALGYRSHQTVDIKAGQIIPMKISPPDGRVSVNAVPWAQVSINGKLVGETPLGNLPLPVGEHEVTFRHPQLGEQTQKVIVKSSALTRVSATFAR